MPKDIKKAAKRVSAKSKKIEKQRKTQPVRRKEHWLYGFHLKYRYVRRLSEKFGLPYEIDPCRGLYQWHSITHRGKDAIVLTFMQDDGRKRLHLNRLTEEEMERVRVELLLPEGSTPKWYNINIDDVCDDYAELSSEDEDLPPFEPLTPLPARSRTGSSNADADQHEVGASGKDPDKSIAGSIGENHETIATTSTRREKAKREKTIQRSRGNCRRKRGSTKNS